MTVSPKPIERTPRRGLRRIAALGGAEFVLLRRNKLLIFNAVVFPMLPILLLAPMKINGKLDGETLSLFMAISMALTMIFVIYYNMLAAYVSRREDLVLKRLRTGECSDSEILLSIAAPGFVIATAIAVVSAGLGFLLLGRSPANILLLLAVVPSSVVLFVALALVTSLFTRTAEAAQITSLPVVLVCMFGAGFQTSGFPEGIRVLLPYTPLAPAVELTRLGWEGRTRSGEIVSFAGTFGHAWQPALVILAWTALCWFLATSYLRWEPRS